MFAIQNKRLKSNIFQSKLLVSFISYCFFIIYFAFFTDLPLAFFYGLLVGFIPVLTIVLDNEQDLLKSVNLFLFWFTISIIVGGIVIFYYSPHPWLLDYDFKQINTQNKMNLLFTYALIGIISIIMGYNSDIGKNIAKRIPKFYFFKNIAGNIIQVSFLLFLICLFATMIALRSYGWFSLEKSTTDMIHEGMTRGGGMVFSLFTECGTIGFLLLYVNNYNKKRSFIEKVLLMSFLFFPISSFLVSGSKGSIIRYLVYVIVVKNYLEKKINIRSCVIYSSLIIFLAFLFQSYRISGGINNILFFQELIGQNITNPMVYYDNIVGRSAGAENFLLILDKVPQHYPFQYGNTLLRVFTSFIPRTIWVNKPFSFGIDFARAFYDDYSGLTSVSPSTIGELYINFHVVGIIIGFIIIGIYLKFIYAYCIQNHSFKEGLLIYCILIERMIVLVDGPIVDYIVFVSLSLFPIALVKFFVTGIVLSKKNYLEKK